MRDAKPPPRFEVKAPEGAPNVIVILIDDCGFGASSAFGGPVDTPPHLLEETRAIAPAGLPAALRPSVVARFTIDPEGRIRDIRLSKATDPRLEPGEARLRGRWASADLTREAALAAG